MNWICLILIGRFDLRYSYYVICLLVLTVIILTPVLLNAEEPKPVKKAIAVRINHKPPMIDGNLDDETWRNELTFEEFTQHDPHEGRPATERTTFQIVYDNEAIYFGVECYETDPDKITSRLMRRDNYGGSDSVSIHIDPRFDHQTGYWFTAQVSGSVSDGVFFNDGMTDSTWDGVWEVKTRIHDKGWTAEYRIPYHVLRFNPKEEYVWGFNVDRNISRKKEFDQWVLLDRSHPGQVSRWGILEGIKDISPPTHLELTPYGMGRTIRSDENDYSGNIGVDIRYGLTSSTSLNATVNPDFGQVEADPSELNLTAFESYFSERRPFFVEGASIFQNMDYGIFYSRRIGKIPDRFAIPENTTEISRPQSTTILSATKLTGKTSKNTAFGIMEAVTAPEYAVIERDVNGKKVREDFLVEPLTNYLVGRMKKDVLKGNSHIGLITTAVNRKDSESAYVGGTDWSLKFRENIYEFSGTIATSHAGLSDDRKNGYIAHFEFDRKGGWWGGETGLSAISPGLDISDLGIFKKNDRIRWWIESGVSRDKRFGIYRQIDTYFSTDLAWNYNRTNTGKGLDIGIWGEFLNYWWMDFNIGKDFESMNDDEVQRDGPLMKRPASYFMGGDIHTDGRKMLAIRLSPSMWSMDDGKSYQRRMSVECELRPTTNFEFRIEPAYSHRISYAQWIDRYEEVVNNKTIYHYVFGELDSKTVDVMMRGNICFTPNLTLEIFFQPFVAIGDYDAIKELARPESYEFKIYNINENKDFHYRSFKSNIVLRWEFKPGSTLFVVWAQSREASLENPSLDDLELRPYNRLKSSFTDNGSNVFLVKVNYWLGI
jgi:hypothetical protein